ncbi:hypothetical protein [Porphyrobacter sp. ULC335]|uniref:hypothetical protein n=1 Tax=Porphyrobacter sp. ULC335 TaxID=2854260 RepID=UPI0022210671|nr:hypothetical protein [Porphyrobacter sp. ULC335]UYV16573.1 hypothetical protein KVF90_04425 [Porphyrobacter sp. ULC335]
MFSPLGLRLCQFFMLLQVFSYTDTVRSISRGAFDTIGLVGPMVRMEAVANGFSALGWAMALALTFTSLAPLAGRVVFVLAGMMWFDVLTTWPLDMPLPDGFLYWGSAVVLIQLAIGLALDRRFGAAASGVVPGWSRYACIAFALVFAWSAFSVWRGDFADSALPAIVLGPHAIANGIAAAGWIAVFAMATAGRSDWAGRFGLFLLGMWFWDMVTTLPLALPLPPAQAVWGPLSVGLMLAVLAPLFGRIALTKNQGLNNE